MANDVEPMDIDMESEFDNKENTCHGNLLLLDRQHSAHKFPGSASTAPMSKSLTGHSFTPDQNEHLTRSLGPLPTNNDVPRLVKLPLTEISSEASSSKEEPRSIRSDLPHGDVTVTINDDIDENISFPSSSSSSPSTPLATTPTKEILKPTGSPIMRGLKSMLSMFRPSQSPIVPIENECEQDKSCANENMNNLSAVNNPEVVNNNLKTMSSTPISKEINGSKRNSPLRESIIFKEELSNELTWRNDSTIIFSEEKIPIHKLFYNHIAPAPTTTKQNKEIHLNESVEPMDISCIEPIITEVVPKSDEAECNKSFSETKLLDDTGKDDSIFVDCESTFNIDSCDESQLLRTFDAAEDNPIIYQDTKDNEETKPIVEGSQISLTSVECTPHDSTLKETLETSKIINEAASENISSTEGSKLILEKTKTLDVLNSENQNTLNTTNIIDTTTLIKSNESESVTLATPAILNNINSNNSHIHVETSTVLLNTTQTFHSSVQSDDCSPGASDNANIKLEEDLDMPNAEIPISNQTISTSFTSTEVQKLEVSLQEIKQYEALCLEIGEEAINLNNSCLDNEIKNNKYSLYEDSSQISNVENAQRIEMVDCKIHQDTEVDSHINSNVESFANDENKSFQIASEEQVVEHNDQPYENSLMKESEYVKLLNDHESKTTDELHTLKDTTVEFNECIINEHNVNNTESLQNSTMKLNSEMKFTNLVDTIRKHTSLDTKISENTADTNTIVAGNHLKNYGEFDKNLTNLSDIETISTSSLIFNPSTIIDTNQLEISSEKSIFKHENNNSDKVEEGSPFEQVDKVIKSANLDFDNIEDPFATKQKIRMSPPATPSRKSMERNNQFDDFENPFATRTKIRLSPPPTKRFVSDDQHGNNYTINENPQDIFSQNFSEVSNTEEVKVNSDIKHNESNIKTDTELLNDNYKDFNLENETILPGVNQPDIVKDSSVLIQNKEDYLQSQCNVTEKLSNNDMPEPNNTFSLDNCSNQCNAKEIINESKAFELDNEVIKSRVLPIDNDVLLKETDGEENIVPHSISADSEVSKSVNGIINVTHQSDNINVHDQLVNKDIASSESGLCSMEDELHNKINLTSEIDFKTVIDSDYNNVTKSLGIDSDPNKTTIQSNESEQTGNINIQCDDETSTEDEDTLEGPFFDMENTCSDDKMELNPFTDYNLPVDETEPGEMFIDAQAFEFLMNQNVNFMDNGKESLFLKFDPLCAPKLNADGVTAALSKITTRENISSECTAPLNKLNATEDTISDDSVDDLNTTVSHKPTMAVTPAVSNVTATPRNNTDTHVRFNLHTSQSPAVAVIDQLLSLSANNSPARRESATSQVPVQNEAQITLMHLQQVLTEKTQNILELRRESVQLKERLIALESQMKLLESQNEEKLKKINDLNEALADKTKVNKSMASVVEEYERTIAVLISETEQEKKQHAEERTKLMSERDEQTAHLASMEVSFSDLHSKYEKSKQIILSYKANEDVYKKSLVEFEQSVKKMQTNYDSLKQHATAKLNQANVEFEKINRAHETEVLKLNTVIKRKELHINSLEESLIQKTKANEELTAICDELITKVG